MLFFLNHKPCTHQIILVSRLHDYIVSSPLVSYSHWSQPHLYVSFQYHASIDLKLHICIFCVLNSKSSAEQIWLCLLSKKLSGIVLLHQHPHIKSYFSCLSVLVATYRTHCKLDLVRTGSILGSIQSAGRRFHSNTVQLSYIIVTD